MTVPGQYLCGCCCADALSAWLLGCFFAKVDHFLPASSFLAVRLVLAMLPYQLLKLKWNALPPVNQILHLYSFKLHLINIHDF